MPCCKCQNKEESLDRCLSLSLAVTNQPTCNGLMWTGNTNLSQKAKTTSLYCMFLRRTELELKMLNMFLGCLILTIFAHLSLVPSPCVALLDLDSMKLQQWLGPFHMYWRTTMHGNGLLTIFQECLHMYYSLKIVRKPFACMVFL